MNLVPARTITGDVARLAGFGEKSHRSARRTGRRKETTYSTDTVASRGLQALRAALAGRVFVPGEAGYDQARRGWNLAVDTRPAVVAEAGSAAGVAQAVRYARGHGMRIAPQGVTVPAAHHGLAALAGSSPSVDVAGYTLGGGLGWLARRYGLAANSVTAAELVTPDGDPVHTDTAHQPGTRFDAGG